MLFIPSGGDSMSPIGGTTGSSISPSTVLLFLRRNYRDGRGRPGPIPTPKGWPSNPPRWGIFHLGFGRGNFRVQRCPIPPTGAWPGRTGFPLRRVVHEPKGHRLRCEREFLGPGELRPHEVQCTGPVGCPFFRRGGRAGRQRGHRLTAKALHL